MSQSQLNDTFAADEPRASSELSDLGDSSREVFCTGVDNYLTQGSSTNSGDDQVFKAQSRNYLITIDMLCKAYDVGAS